MAQTDAPTADPAESPKRRVIFPWAWLGLLVGARFAFGLADVTVDFKNLATIASVMLGLLGVCGWYAIRGRASLPKRLAIAAAPFALLFIFSSLYELKFNGAGGVIGLHRRGAEKADQQLAAIGTASADEGIADWGSGSYDYPRFLGNGPWAEAVGPALSGDWETQRPELIWRRELGAGWSSFAVLGTYAITQEQRGTDELVVCYDLRTGEPVWSRADPVRFDPQDFAGNMGRQGPRATPTIIGERVYTQGAEGLVNCLDALTGELIWQVATTEEYGTQVPVWGKSGSPAYIAAGDGVDRDLLVVSVGAPTGSTEADHDASLVAFDAETGEEVWSSGWRQTSYSSPQVVTLQGERLVLQVNDDVMTAFSPVDGSEAFDHFWSGQSDNAPSCSQPIQLAGDRLLMTKGYGHGSSLFEIDRDGETWSIEPVWQPAIKRVLQTKYSNPVIRGDYAYALNGEMLQCVEVATGKNVWRKRRSPKFGFGQVLLHGEHLLVSCEESGEVVLVKASPEGYEELGALQALTEGETCWNNPVVTGDILLVRNAVEAAAYRLPLADGEVLDDAEGSVAAR